MTPELKHTEEPIEELVGESRIEREDAPVVHVPEKIDRALPMRVVSGAAYAVINVVAIAWGAVPTALLMSVTAGLCCWEFFRLMRADAKMPNQPLGIFFAAAFPLLALANMVYTVAGVGLLLMALGIWYVVNQRARITDVAVTAFGSLYTGLMLSAIVGIRCSSFIGYSAVFNLNSFGMIVRHPGALTDFGAIMLCLCVILSIWANDAFAYFVGIRFGRHKLVPRISPKKSWEGLAGGIVGSVLVWSLMLLLPDTGVTVPVALVGGVVCGITGVVGDLVESRIKRGAGVKDSGNMMPGHGGILDRSDSLLFAGVSAYFVLRLMGVL